MTQYFTDFGDYTSESDVFTEWSHVFDSESHNWSFNGDSITVNNNTSSQVGIKRDDIGEHSDIEIAYKVKTSNYNNIGPMRAYLRAKDSNNTYLLSAYSDNPNGPRMGYYDGGSWDELGTDSKSFSNDLYYWVRFRINGSNLKAKVWVASNSEPTSWDIETTDSTITGDGFAAIGSYNTTGEDTYQKVGIGTNGDSAPLVGVEAPSQPRNVTATVNANDSITLDWDAPSDWGGEQGNYRVQMEKDNTGYSYPEGGDKTPPSGTTSQIFTMSSDHPYEEQIGIDASYRFRIRAENSAGNSGWDYSSTVYTEPVPPHNPSVSRPDGDTVTISADVKSDIAEDVLVEYREDTGSGYGSWTNFDFLSHNEPDSGDAGNVGGSWSHSYSVGESTQYTNGLQADARYQFRLRTRSQDNNTYSTARAYADYGNSGNVYFEDDFESGDLSTWGETSLSDPDSGIQSGAVTDLGIDGPDQGSNYLRLDGGDWVKILGNWNTEPTASEVASDETVLVKAVVAVGSMDNSSEAPRLQWYDGGWQTLETLNWEYNKQGWFEVNTLVSASLLSSNADFRFIGVGGGGDYFAIDRIIISDVLHEYTTPAAPSGLTLDDSVSGELTATWTVEATFPHGSDNIDIKEGNDSSWTSNWWRSSPDTFSSGGSMDYTIYDGITYEVRINSFARQDRNGNGGNSYHSSEMISTQTTTPLPSPTTFSIDAINGDTYDLSWTPNANNGTIEVLISANGGSSYVTDASLANTASNRTTSPYNSKNTHHIKVQAKTDYATSDSSILIEDLAGDVSRYSDGAVETTSSGETFTEK